MPKFIFREADLNKFPQRVPADPGYPYNHIGLGDLHGNTMKLIYTLIEEEIVSGISPADFKKLGDIQKRPISFVSAKNIKNFEDILDRCDVHPEKAVTLFGDDLADRGGAQELIGNPGGNDYFTILVYDRLRRGNCRYNILLSNHLLEFLRDYERQQFTGQHTLGKTPDEDQACTLTNMVLLIDRGLISEKRVRELVELSLLPMIKAVGYSLEAGENPDLFMHAPCGFETIQALAKKFHVDFNLESAESLEAFIEDLIRAIDEINAAVADLLESKQFTSLLREEQEAGCNSNARNIPLDYPLHRLLWTRDLGLELVTKTVRGYEGRFIHGHIGPSKVTQTLPLGVKIESSNHFCLDNLLGKYYDTCDTNAEGVEHTLLQSCSQRLTQDQRHEFFEKVQNPVSGVSCLAGDEDLGSDGEGDDFLEFTRSTSSTYQPLLFSRSNLASSSAAAVSMVKQDLRFLQEDYFSRAEVP